MTKSFLRLSSLLVFFIVSSCHDEVKEIKSNPMIEAVQFRIARPTNNLSEVSLFYKQGIGLQEIGYFSGHEGYDGLMLGLPDSKHHLEFTQHIDQTPLPEPTKENLLVFYFDNPDKYASANKRLQEMNFFPVEPENPYWKGKSETYEDPDKWRVVLFNGVYKP